MTRYDPTLEIGALLAQGMGLKLHWFPADVPAARLAAVMAGMANTQGGTVLLGVAPRSPQVTGLPDPEAALDQVFQAALLVDPPLVIPVPRQAQAGVLSVLVVSVPAGLPQVYSLDGRFLGRDGAQTNPLPARRLRQLLVERGVVQFETQAPPDAGLDDLDWDKVEQYVQALGLPGGEPPAQVLLRRGCLRAGAGLSESSTGDTSTAGAAGRGSKAGELADLRPTYAALLLFGKHPQQWLPAAGILAARFSGPALADRFSRQDIQGTLPEQIRLAEIFVREHLRYLSGLDGLERSDIPEYPLEAVRELLVNAAAHRDYNNQGDSIHINLFSDRLEVHSPGGLPGPMTLENLLEARFSRNAVIMQVLADMGFVERLGYGLNRVMETARRSGLRTPEFAEAGGAFRVTLYRNPAFDQPAAPADLSAFNGQEFTPRQQQALGFLLARRRITSRDYQELCPGVHAETLRRDLVDLVERGLLVKIGDKRATYYVLKK